MSKKYLKIIFTVMKGRVLLFFVVAVSAFSLQSCVTNYVVSAPQTYSTENDPNNKLSTAGTKNQEDYQQLISRFAAINAKKIATENAEKNAEIEKTIKHSRTIDGILATAETYLGTPYRYGGMTRNGIDCSAFVLSVFGIATGIYLPRIAAAQSQQGEKISKENLQKGDLLFFAHGKRISHVGIVYDVTPEGEIKFIHASTSSGVMISTLNTDSYWSPKFRFAKRIIDTEGNPELNIFANNQAVN
jgi:lipoprotein Spr